MQKSATPEYKAEVFSKMFIPICYTTQNHIPENCNCHISTLKSHKTELTFTMTNQVSGQSSVRGV
jgi:hypothetical protein